MKDRALELLGLFGRVGIVKPDDVFALICLMRKVVIEERSFGVADMEVASEVWSV